MCSQIRDESTNDCDKSDDSHRVNNKAPFIRQISRKYSVSTCWTTTMACECWKSTRVNKMVSPAAFYFQSCASLDGCSWRQCFPRWKKLYDIQNSQISESEVRPVKKVFLIDFVERHALENIASDFFFNLIIFKKIKLHKFEKIIWPVNTWSALLLSSLTLKDKLTFLQKKKKGGGLQ